MQDVRIDSQCSSSVVDFSAIKTQVASVSAKEKENIQKWAKAVIEEQLQENPSSIPQLLTKYPPSCFVDISNLPKEFQDIDTALKDEDGGGQVASQWLLADGLAAASIADRDHLLAAWLLLPIREAAWAGFEAGIESVYRKSPSEVEEVFIALANKYHDFPEMIGVMRDEKVQFNDAVRHWRKNTSIRSVWDYRELSYFSIHYIGAGLFSLAIKMDLNLGIRLLEIAQLPQLCEYVFYSLNVFNDRAKLIEMIKKGVNVLSEDDKCAWNHFIVAPMAIEVICAHVNKLYDSYPKYLAQRSDDAGVSKFQKEEAPDIFKEASRALLLRSDGAFIACHYLSRLAQSLPARADARWSEREVFFDVLAEEMNEYGVGLDEFARYCDWSLCDNDKFEEAKLLGVEVDTCSLPSVYDYSAMLSIISVADATKFDEKMAIYYFEQILFSNNNGIFNYPRNGSHILAWYHYKLALMYLGHDAVERWRQTWANLASVRHRIRYNPFQVEGLPQKSVECVALVGVAIADWLSSDELYPEATHLEMLEEVWNAVYGVWLRYNGTQDDFWDELIKLILIRLGVYYDKKGANEVRVSLLPYFKKMGGANHLIALTACNLKLNISHQSFLELESVVAPAVKNFIEQEKYVVERQVGHPKLVEACNALF